MKTRCHVGLLAHFVVLAILILVILGGLAWQRLRLRQPEYHGKTLTAWLEQYDRNADSTPEWFDLKWYYLAARAGGVPFRTNTVRMVSFLIAGRSASNPILRDEAAQAIQQIGTNAVPQLLRWAAFQDSPTKTFLIKHWPISGRLMKSLGLEQAYLTYLRWAAESVSRPWQASIGFKVLGAQGGPAMPGLLQVMRLGKNAYGRAVAARALGSVGAATQESIAALTQNLKDPDSLVRRASVDALIEIYRESQVRGARKDCFDTLLPLLHRLLADPGSDKDAVRRVLEETDDPASLRGFF